jgi:hypothetical protein
MLPKITDGLLRKARHMHGIYKSNQKLKKRPTHVKDVEVKNKTKQKQTRQQVTQQIDLHLDFNSLESLMQIPRDIDLL